MKTQFTIFILAMIFSNLKASHLEPCNKKVVPEHTQGSKVVFEIPTYAEYVHDIVLKSVSRDMPTSEENILSQKAYTKIRNRKVQAIKATKNKDFVIVSTKMLNADRVDTGFLVQEILVTNLVSKNNLKFEDYTNFILTDVTTSTQYTLIDVSDDASSNCVVEKGDYKYVELLSLIKE